MSGELVGLTLAVSGGLCEVTGLLIVWFDLQRDIKAGRDRIAKTHRVVGFPPPWLVYDDDWQQQVRSGFPDLRSYLLHQQQLRQTADGELRTLVLQEVGKLLSGNPRRRISGAVLFLVGAVLQMLGSTAALYALIG